MRAIPLLAIVVAIYNVLAFMAPELLVEPLLVTYMPSGGGFVVLVVDAVVALGLFMLFLEIAKATRTAAGAVLDHMLSMLLFVICLVELLLVKEMASSSFVLAFTAL